jgi:hypothetical protein
MEIVKVREILRALADGRDPAMRLRPVTTAAHAGEWSCPE